MNYNFLWLFRILIDLIKYIAFKIIFPPFHISRTIFLVERIFSATMLKNMIVIAVNTGYIVLVVVYVIFQYMSDVI